MPKQPQDSYMENRREVSRRSAAKRRAEDPDKFREYKKAWRAANPDKNSASNKRSKERCKERIRSWRKEYNKRPDVKERNRQHDADRYPKERARRLKMAAKRMSDPVLRDQKSAYDRAWNLRNKFGLSMEDFDALYERQGKGCAICGAAKTVGKRGHLHVDHDHISGNVRGLLCQRCNTALGLLGDQKSAVKKWTAKALRYLEKKNAKT